MMVTWDFENNMERGTYQKVRDPKSDVGLHVVKGMNYKMNYLISKDYLVDLEHNIPLSQSNVDQGLDTSSVSYSKQLEMINQFINQRKVYKDNQKFLGIEKPSCLYYPLSRMDILLWQNIVSIGDDIDAMNTCIDCSMINLVIDGETLFHYYAGNAEAIEIFQKKFNQRAIEGWKSPTDATLPLQIVNPNNHSQSALFLSISK